MRSSVVAGAAFAALGIWLLLGPPRDVSRVRRLTLSLSATEPAASTEQEPSSSVSVDGRAGQRAPSRRSPMESASVRRLVAGMAGFAAAVLVGGWLGVAVGVLAGFAGTRWLSGLETTAVRRARLMVARDLPLAAELLGAALRAGVPLGRAVDAVAEALGGPLGKRLMTCRWAEIQGVAPHDAWQPLTADPATAGLGRLVLESAVRGTAPAAALGALATDLRTSARLAADGAARSVGARVAAPLGLCFLPAFLLLGVVPLVAAAAAALVP